MKLDKGVLTNITIVLLIALTMFSAYKYVITLREKFEIQQALILTQQKTNALLEEKRKLLQDIEKEKEVVGQLTEANAELKEYLRASHRRIKELFQEYGDVNAKLKEMSEQFSVLKAESDSSFAQKEELAKENQQLQDKLTTTAEVKKAVRELRGQVPKVIAEIRKHVDTQDTRAGNRGYLIMNGESTHPATLIIEVVPSAAQE